MEIPCNLCVFFHKISDGHNRCSYIDVALDSSIRNELCHLGIIVRDIIEHYDEIKKIIGTKKEK